MKVKRFKMKVLRLLIKVGMKGKRHQERDKQIIEALHNMGLGA